MAGYFIFPPGLNYDPRVFRHFRDEVHGQSAVEQAKQQEDDARERAWEERQKREEEALRRLRERERELGLEGEMDWVRMGGFLRDDYGRKDVARTEFVREQARLRDEERRVLDRWNAYEARWRDLLASHSAVAFMDIPWPVDPIPKFVTDLTAEAVADFLNAPLQVRANTVSRKDRIRASLLRWHPDKLAAVVSRTVEDDLDTVREGINTIFRILKSMQDSDRHPDTHS